jgi:5-methylcytosine-specific restriction protein B
VIGVYINDAAFMFMNVRDMALSETFDWYYKKSFRHIGATNQNQLSQEKAFNELKIHGFVMNNSNAFYVGTYEKQNHPFTEPIGTIKGRLIIAAAIFADIRDVFTFPKG